MKLLKISAATLALMVLLATPAMAINIAPRPLYGSVVKTQPWMIHAPASTPTPVVVVTPPPTPTPTPAPQVPASSLTVNEQQMVAAINQARAVAGVAPVKADLRLVAAARIKANDLYVNNYFSHVSPVFGYTSSLLPGLGLSTRYVCENIAGNRSVAAAQAAFMLSIGHRTNILDPYVTHVGVAALEGISPYNLYVQVFAHE